jgi:hypothetical protein
MYIHDALDYLAIEKEAASYVCTTRYYIYVHFSNISKYIFLKFTLALHTKWKTTALHYIHKFFNIYTLAEYRTHDLLFQMWRRHRGNSCKSLFARIVIRRFFCTLKWEFSIAGSGIFLWINVADFCVDHRNLNTWRRIKLWKVNMIGPKVSQVWAHQYHNCM